MSRKPPELNRLRPVSTPSERKFISVLVVGSELSVVTRIKENFQAFPQKGTAFNLIFAESLGRASTITCELRADFIVYHMPGNTHADLNQFRSFVKDVNPVPVLLLGSPLPEEFSITALKLSAHEYFSISHLESKSLLSTIDYVLDRSGMRKILIESAESARQASRMKSEFIANMSHEIRTPMNGVIGMTSLLMDMNLPGEAKACVETIRSSGNQLLNLINDILDLSKIEAGRLELETVEFNLRDLIEETLDLHSERALNKGLTMANIVAPDVPSIVRHDAGRIRQILSNLVSNAVKFTHAGSVCINSRLRKDRNGMHWVIVDVVDTGCGISQADRTHLFKPFSQSAQGRAHAGGTGLGLTICRKLSRLLGGNVTCKSSPGEGSTFSLTIPIGSEVQKTIVPRISLEKKRGLILSPSGDRRGILMKQLMLRRMQAEMVEQSTEFFAKIRRARIPFDFLIIDTQFEQTDRTADLLANLEAVSDGEGIPPVIVLTPRTGIPRIAARSGVHFCNGNPLKQSQIYRQIARALGESPVEKQQASETTLITAIEALKARKLRILLTEDNPVNQMVGRKMLEKIDAKIDVAQNGSECIDFLNNLTYDVILMDCQMPVMDGFEATLKIRERKDGKQNTIIVAMTAQALREDRQKCLSHGMNDYLAKPVTINALYEKLLIWTSDNPVTQSSKKKGEVMGASNGLLDTKTILSVLELNDSEEEGQEFLKELLEIYKTTTPEIIEQLRTAASGRDQDQLFKLFHKGKGASANIGASGVAGICKELEALCRNHIPEDIGNRIDGLERVYSETLTAFESFLSERRNGVAATG